MATITNTDTAGHWCDALKQWLPGRTSATNATAAQAAAIAATNPVFSTSVTLEVVETVPEDGTPSRVSRSHR